MMFRNEKLFNKIHLAVLSSLLVSSGAMAGTIAGSAHDFTDDLGWTQTYTDQICIFCHTPHNADSSIIDAPLWNHETTDTVFQLYDSPTLDATDIDQPAGSSILCLSCHDGTVAVDAFGGRNGTYYLPTNSKKNLGGETGDDLTNDHPISFTFDSALASADGALHDPATTLVTIGSGDKVKSGTLQDVMLYNDQLQCASCHDVHNNFVYQDDANKLLKISPAGSQICLTCHDK